MCRVCGCYRRGHSGDGCVLASTLCKYDLRKGDLFVLSWARVRRVRRGSISSELLVCGGGVRIMSTSCRQLHRLRLRCNPSRLNPSSVMNISSYQLSSKRHILRVVECHISYGILLCKLCPKSP